MSQSLMGSWDFGWNRCSVTSWMPELILFDHTSPTCCLKAVLEVLCPCSARCWVQFHEGLCRNHCPELQVPLCLLELLFSYLCLGSRGKICRAWILFPVNGASGLWASPAAGSALGFGVGQSHLGKAWFCCFRSTGSFSGLLLDLYPKLSQFQPINLLISFPSPCGTPGKGKCHTLDVVWICVLHRWGRHLETFFSANTQEQLRLQLRYWGWDKRSSPEEKIRI